MSEAMQPNPGPSPEGATILPFDRKVGLSSPEKRQQHAFDLASDLLFDDLGSAERRKLHGLELANAIETALSSPQGDDSHTTRLHVALRELAFSEASRVESGGIESEDNYLEKQQHDPIFRLLEDKIKEFLNQRSMAPQRHAGRRLHEMRMLSIDNQTKRDNDWQNVIERLFV